MKNLEHSFYLSEDQNLDVLTKITELSTDEIEEIVGRFNQTSLRAGKLKGEVLVGFDGQVEIRHHFTKKTLWRS